jgi:putative NIF3 family GTP cyclohydrolase 1 type 2
MEVATLVRILLELAPDLAGMGPLKFAPAPLGDLNLNKLGVAVDPTPSNIRNAITGGVDLLICYHPWTGEAEHLLRENSLRIIALHEAWDNSPYGAVTDLAETLGLTGEKIIDGLTIGEADSNLRSLIEGCQRALSITVVPFCGELLSPVRRVGIKLGAGLQPHRQTLWETCRAQGCDTLLSGELTMAAVRFSANQHLKMIDLGHSTAVKASFTKFHRLLAERLQEQNCQVQFFENMYAGSYFTNYSIADSYTEEVPETIGDDESLPLFSLFDKME